MQILPSAKGIKQNLIKEMGGAANEAGASAGSKITSLIKSAIAAAGIGKVLKEAILAGADMEQLEGGVEKLFGGAAETVKQNASDAFKNAGMSANEYMETVTSFSASLIAGLGGDTAKAAGIADMAIKDMADNANTFGTDIASIQAAYQGFAKQNYTMLDNLKLGYGGTASEMARLINESGVLGDTTKVTAETLNEVSFDKMIEAINVVQSEMNITGTTANEAAGTISGSFESMKSAAQNLLANMTLGKDISQELDGLTVSIKNFLGNILPAVSDIISALPEILIEMMPLLTDIVIEIILSITSAVIENLPMLLDAAVQVIVQVSDALIGELPLFINIAIQLILALIGGLQEAVPDLIAAALEIIPELIDALLSAIPEMIDAGVTLLVSLVEDLPTIISSIVTKLPQIITGITGKISELIPMIVNAGVQLFVALITNLPTIIIEIVKAVPQIISALISGFGDMLGSMADVGLNLIKGIWNGISNAASWLWEKVSGWCSQLLGKIKGFFGIHSPSTVFAGIGDNLMLGLAGGIDKGSESVFDAIDDVTAATMGAINGNMDINSTLSISGANTSSSYTDITGLLEAIIIKLDNLGVYLDGDLLVGGITSRMDRSLGSNSVLGTRGVALG